MFDAFRCFTLDGHTYWANPGTGRVYPHVAGGAEGDPPASDPPAGGDRDQNQPDPLAELGKVEKRARADGHKAAVAEVADQLGCTVEEAKSLIASVRAAEDAQKSEAQRALEAANQAKAEAEQARSEAAVERVAAKVERRLLAAGVPDTALARAARMVTVAPDADDDAIAAEIDTLKSEVPALFAPAGHTPPPPGVDPSKQPRHKAPKSGIEAGRERARQEREATKTLDPFAHFKPVGF